MKGFKMQRTLTVGDAMDIQGSLNELIDPDWKKNFDVYMLRTAMVEELGEFMNSGRQWKWWKKHTKRPDEWNEKLELVDVAHFYLSAMLLDPNAEEFAEFGEIVSDQTHMFLFNQDSSLNHEGFAKLASHLLQFTHPTTLQMLIRGSGMLPEEFSAIYMAKVALNRIRQHTGYQSGTYRKVIEGVEDNDRLCHIVEAFLNDPAMSLKDVTRSVWDEFTGHPEPQGG